MDGTTLQMRALLIASFTAVGLFSGCSGNKTADPIDREKTAPGTPQPKTDGIAKRESPLTRSANSRRQPTADPQPPDLEGSKGARLRTTAASREPQRWALLVGVTKYSHLPSLRFCAHDMQKLEDVLVASGGYPKKNVKLVADVGQGKTAADTSRVAVQKAWRELVSQVAENDTLLFAFSGHGMEDDGKGYLMTSDGDPKNVAATALSMAWIYELLDKCPAKSKVVLVDACHSGATKGKSFSQQTLVGGDGVYGMFSCKSNQESWEDPNLQHGVFTYYLINALRGEADLRENNGNGDNSVSADEVFRYLSKKVPNHVKSHFRAAQEPFRRVASSGDHILSQYKFRPVPENTALMTLPGLTGDWWFEETPWLLPLVRTAVSEQLARKLDAGKIAVLLKSPQVAATRNALHAEFTAIIRTQTQSALPKELLYQIGNWKGGELRDSEKAALLDGLQAAGDRHSLAVVQHHFGMKEAGANYKLALQNYAKNRAQAVGRYALCLVDYGRWLAGTGNPRGACAQFQLARDLISDSRAAPQFHVDAWCVEADSRRKLGEWKEAGDCLQAAEKIAREQLGESHPLTSHVHRRFAWMDMDQWKLGEARRHFEEANRTALLVGQAFQPDASGGKTQEAQATSGQAGKPGLQGAADKLDFRARVNMHHNNHGLAMCSRYSGDSADAIRRYRKLQQTISRELRSTTDPLAVSALKGRLLNTMERLADCYLFAAKPQARIAADVYRQSYRMAAELADEPNDPTRDRLACKRIMALSLLDSPDATVTAELEGIEQLKPAKTIALFHQIAVAMSKQRRDPTEKGRQALRDALTRLAGKEHRSFTRDEYDLLFLSSRELIRAETKATLLAADVERLFDLIPAKFRRPEVLPYQRAFYDAAITAWLKHVAPARMVDLLVFVSIAKTGNHPGLLGSDRTVVFYFPADKAATGYALVYSTDGKSQVIPLTETSEQIQKASLLVEPGTAPFLKLPAPLQPIMNAETTEVHWKDVVLKLDSPHCPYAHSKDVYFLAE